METLKAVSGAVAGFVVLTVALPIILALFVVVALIHSIVALAFAPIVWATSRPAVRSESAERQPTSRSR